MGSLYKNTTLLNVAYMLHLIMEIKPRRIRIYETENGKRPFEEWVKDLRDPPTARRIQARLAGVSAGNLGDTKSVGEGVNELRLAFGAGYRIYFGSIDNELIILLCGGDKSSQDKDIKKAKEYWSDYRSKNYE
jgi:putative addiction module killer protein